MDDRTLMTVDEDRTLMQPQGETTQMVASVPCPICEAQNTGLATWCAECGFRLGSEPGVADESIVVARYSLARAGESFPLKTGDNAVGRLNADVFLSDASVSRRHAVVSVSDEGVSVRDEGSSNGTRVNGAKLQPSESVKLEIGDTVEFGSESLSLHGPADEREPAPPIDPGAATDPEVSGRPDPELVQAAGQVPSDQVSAESRASAQALSYAHLTDGQTDYALKEGPNSIGRRAENDVTISDSFVSGRHALLTLSEGQATLVDTGSSNGTFLGETRLNPGEGVTLSPDDEIRVGQTTLRLVWTSPDPAETQDQNQDVEADIEPFELPANEAAFETQQPGADAGGADEMGEADFSPGAENRQ